MAQNENPYLLQLSGITKAYPGCLANDAVDLSIMPGEIHALLGENGAGKSTLVKIIYGVLKADAGEIRFKGQLTKIANPAAARALGIAMVFQHFSLFDSLTVVENISLGIDTNKDLETLSKEIIELSNRYGLPLDPNRHVYTLSVGERQRIEIIRCLLQDPKLLVMDEPTSVLTPQETEKLFVTLKRLSDEGMSILYISHKLAEIKALCQNATILRLGKKVATVAVAEQSPASLAALMMGEELKVLAPREKPTLGKVRLAVNDLSMSAKSELGIALKQINLSVHAGEIVGIAGVAGNGQDELLKALNGEQKSSNANSIQIDNQACGTIGPNERRALGLASVPEKRLGHGAVPEMSLIENAFLTSYLRLNLTKKGIIDYPSTEEFTNRVIKDFSVKTPAAESFASSLSGGNLQKFIIGRELSQNPEVLIVSQPTWGVDAGAAHSIRLALRELAASGAAVLVISQDLDELMEICDRVGAICGGELSTFYPTETITYEKMGLLMAGVKSD